MEEKRNHSNDPSSTQPIDEKGRYQKDPKANNDKEENGKILPVEIGKDEDSSSDFSDDDLLALGDDLSDEWDDKDLIALSNDISDEWDDEDVIPFTKRKDFDPQYPRKGGLENVNPNFSYYSYEFSHNCQRCAPTYEVWCRGYNVTAKPRAKGNDDAQKSELPVYVSEDSMYIDRNKVYKEYYNKFGDSPLNDGMMISFVKSNAPFIKVFKGAPEEGMEFSRSLGLRPNYKTVYNKIDKIARNAGSNSRFVLVVTWKGGNSGHAMNVVNVNGEPYIYDAQTGESEKLTEEFFKATRPATAFFFRCDNKEIEPKYLDILMKER